jgi:hypothetical protein
MNDEEVKLKAKKCKELSLRIVDIFMEEDVEFDTALSVLCQLYIKVGLDFDVSPFSLINALSAGLQMNLEKDDETEEPKVHWQGNGTQFH